MKMPIGNTMGVSVAWEVAVRPLGQLTWLWVSLPVIPGLPTHPEATVLAHSVPHRVSLDCLFYLEQTCAPLPSMVRTVLIRACT